MTQFYDCQQCLFTALIKAHRRMPDVRGLTLRDALFLLENRGLKVQATGTGRVREQSVAPGDPARRGLVVGLMLTPTATAKNIEIVPEDENPVDTRNGVIGLSWKVSSPYVLGETVQFVVRHYYA